MGGRGWRAPARNPGASFAPLSPAPATRSIKAPLTEHWCRCNRFWKESAECPSRPSSAATPVPYTNRTPHLDGSSPRTSSVRYSAVSTLRAAFRGSCWTSGKRTKNSTSTKPPQTSQKPSELPCRTCHQGARNKQKTQTKNPAGITRPALDSNRYI